jgi:hypothetical protein
MRCSTKRWRHLPTVGLDQFKREPISWFGTPSAAHKTNRARATRECGRLREAAKLSNCCRSSALNFRAGKGRPIAIPEATAGSFIMQRISGTQH